MSQELSDFSGALTLLLTQIDLGQANTSSPGYVKFKDTAGVARYLFVTTTGELKISSTEPTSDTDGEGTGTLIAEVAIPTASVLTLFGTPYDIIPAPGANKAISIDYAQWYKAAGTAYAGIAAGEDLVLRYTDASGTILTVAEATGFLDQATAQYRETYRQSAVGTVRVELTPTANAKVVAHMTTGEVITGNSDIKVRVAYRIIDTVL